MMANSPSRTHTTPRTPRTQPKVRRVFDRQQGSWRHQPGQFVVVHRQEIGLVREVRERRREPHVLGHDFGECLDGLVMGELVVREAPAGVAAFWGGLVAMWCLGE